MQELQSQIDILRCAIVVLVAAIAILAVWNAGMMSTVDDLKKRVYILENYLGFNAYKDEYGEEIDLTDHEDMKREFR